MCAQPANLWGPDPSARLREAIYLLGWRRGQEREVGDEAKHGLEWRQEPSASVNSRGVFIPMLLGDTAVSPLATRRLGTLAQNKVQSAANTTQTCPVETPFVMGPLAQLRLF